MQSSKMYLVCKACSRTDCFETTVLPDDWHGITLVIEQSVNCFATHTGICPDCQYRLVPDSHEITQVHVCGCSQCGYLINGCESAVVESGEVFAHLLALEACIQLVSKIQNS